MRALIGQFLHASRNLLQQQHAVVELANLNHPEIAGEWTELQESQEALFQLQTHLREYIEEFAWSPAKVDLTETVQAAWQEARAGLGTSLEVRSEVSTKQCLIEGVQPLLAVLFADSFRFLTGCCSSAHQLQSTIQEVDFQNRPAFQVDLVITGQWRPLVSLERWFVPFTRLSGLDYSLAYARRIAEAHAGQLTGVCKIPQEVRLELLLPKEETP